MIPGDGGLRHVSSVTPLVSVVIPCFNQARFLDDALESLVAQNCPDWEAVLVNDGSTDATAEVARRWTARERRIVYIAQRHRGPGAARNRGIAAARGRYVQFLDADDVLLPDKLEVQLYAIRGAGAAAFCYCDYRHGCADDITRPASESKLRVRMDSQDPLHDIALKWETEVSIPINSYLFDARLLTDHAVRFDEHLPSHVDWRFLLAILRVQPCAIFIDRELAIYRMHPHSIVRDLPRMRAGFLTAIRREKRLFAGDARMLRVLAEKERLTKGVYWDHSPWYRFKAGLGGVRGQAPFNVAMETMTRLIPQGEAFALVDEGQWATEDIVAGRRCVRWYSPTDDEAAIRELAGLRQAGVAFLAIGRPGFWWLDYYSRLFRELRAKFPCVLQDDRLVVFDLRREVVREARSTTALGRWLAAVVRRAVGLSSAAPTWPRRGRDNSAVETLGDGI